MRTKVSKKATQKGRKKTTKGGKKKPSYDIYIEAALKYFHPDIGINCNAMSLMNHFVNDTLNRLAAEALVLSKKDNRTTITCPDVIAAVRLLLPPGELAELALTICNKAAKKYSSFESK